MTLIEFLKSLSRDIQNCEGAIAAEGESDFLKDYDDEGKPNTLPFRVGEDVKHIPESVLKSHRPLHHARFCIKSEVYLTPNKAGELEVGFKKRRGVVPTQIEIQYEPEPYTPEAIARHKHELLDHHFKSTTNKGDKT